MSAQDTVAPKPDAPASSAPRLSPMGQLAVDLGPALVFMVSYNLARRSDPANAIFWSTGLFMAATAIALGWAFLVQKRAPPMLLVTAVIVLVFGGLTLYLHDATFAYIKPTIINLLFASAIFGGLLVKRNVWKLLFQSAFELPERIWTILAVRWGLFYVFLAGLNEFIWRTQTEAFWANFKVVGVIPITFLFLLANLPITLKYMGKTDESADAPAPEDHAAR
ncbi:MAG: septation protein A [Alphaproteobacteria bacterium]|nr:septation protein A [Alphaproteobacteria bacterium]